MPLQRISYTERPDLAARLEQEEQGAFPKFLLQDRVWAQAWPHVIGEFAEYQVIFYDPDHDALVGGGNAVPLSWDGTVEGLPSGTHAAMLQSIEQHRQGARPNTSCGIQAIAVGDARGSGLSDAFLTATRERARDHGFEHAITPLRCLLKDRYPLAHMDEYVKWTRDDGSAFDPWLRVWLRAGAELLAVCHDSTVIEGTVAEWEEWTEMELPASGEYVIAGGQAPLRIDREADTGRYSEPHVWMELPLGE